MITLVGSLKNGMCFGTFSGNFQFLVEETCLSDKVKAAICMLHMHIWKMKAILEEEFLPSTAMMFQYLIFIRYLTNLKKLSVYCRKSKDVIN